MQHPFSHLSPLPALPAELPVMVLGECYHLPGTLLPLFIFEQRYRDMLDHVLSTSRMFCVGNSLDPEDDCEHPELFPYATAAVVHASVKQPDGTSHLVLLGLRRVKLTHWVQEEGFRIAAVQPVDSIVSDELLLRELEVEALDHIETLQGADSAAIKSLLEMLREAENPELTCDVLTYHFVRKTKLLRKALKEEKVAARYELLLDELAKIKGRRLGQGQ
jgi:Lon protease-like protein